MEGETEAEKGFLGEGRVKVFFRGCRGKEKLELVGGRWSPGRREAAIGVALGRGGDRGGELETFGIFSASACQSDYGLR